MKKHIYHLFTLIVFLISLSNQQILDLTKYKTATFKATTWKDLASKMVECPNEGVLKNFVLRKSGNDYWFEYQCYSSVKKASDYGDAIIKFSEGSSKSTLEGRKTSSSSLAIIKDIKFRCFVDYALKSFHINVGKNNIVTFVSCHGIKTSFQTPVNVETVKVELNFININTIEPMVDVMVGKEDAETSDIIGYPLCGFKIKVESDKFYFVYSYGKLKNMAKVLDSYKAKFKQLRDNNDQKY